MLARRATAPRLAMGRARRSAATSPFLTVIIIQAILAAAVVTVLVSRPGGGVLFAFPIAICALQASRPLLWTVAAACMLLTSGAGVWAFVHAAAPSARGADLFFCGAAVAAQIILAGFVDLWLHPPETHETDEAKFRGILDAAPDAVIISDAQGVILMANAEAERLFDFPRRELIGRSVTQLAPEAFEQIRRRAQKGKLSLTDRGLTGQRKGGARFPIEISVGPIETSSGVLIASAIRDVTAARQFEERIRLSEESHRMAVEVTEIGTWIWHMEREEIIWSDQFRKIFGLSPDEPPSRAATNRMLHPDDRGMVDKAVRRMVADGAPYDVEYRVVWPDGSVRWIASRGRVHRDLDGQPMIVESTVLDVTDRKSAEEALRGKAAMEREAAELARSNADLSQFAYIAAHDLQEPLRMVASYSALLAKRYRGRLDADADQYIDFAVSGAQRMQALISDLLAYCQVGTTQRPLEETSAQEALDRALFNLEGAIRDSGAVITHDPLPSVTGDGSQLTQLLQNLVGNALKYRSAEVPRIHIGLAEAGPEWILSIRDNGLGIDPRHFEKIFAMFQRLHARDEYTGTGIGLSLCRKIVERHNGRIWVESAPGEGSTFHIALPR